MNLLIFARRDRTLRTTRTTISALALAALAGGRAAADTPVTATPTCVAAAPAGASNLADARCRCPSVTVRLGLYEPFAVNDAGLVVGDLEVNDGKARHAAALLVDGQPIDLGAGASRHAQALAVSERGVIVGRSLVNDREPGPPFRFTVARGYEALPLPSGASAGDALGIDDQGDVLINAFAKNPRRPRSLDLLGATVWLAQHQRFVPLLGLDGNVGEGAAMSGNGLVVGKSYDADGVLRPVLWDATGQARALPFTQRPRAGLAEGEISGVAFATAVNRAGVVVGTISFGDADTRAVAWLPPRYLELDLGPGTAAAINDHDLVGGSAPEADGSQRARLWDLRTGAVVPLLPPADAAHGDYRVLDVNNLGVVVGYDARSEGNQRALRYADARCSFAGK
jgi:uncharacterized membrane protein